MSGRPWTQVQTALRHILGVSATSSVVKTEIITYDSTASRLTGDVAQKVSTLHAGGGTNFRAAFDEVQKVLEARVGTDTSSVDIVFLTDGQANGGCTGLSDAFKQNILDSWTRKWDTTAPPVTVHSVGFSSSCDRDFLEDLRCAGSTPGTFRYTEPNEGEDSLCNKLQSLFELSSKATVIPITVGTTLPLLSSPEAKLFVDTSGTGTYTDWLDMRKHSAEDGFPAVKVTSSLGEVCVPVKVVKPTEDETRSLLGKWYARAVDSVAGELFELAGVGKAKPAQVARLHLCLLQQRLVALKGLAPESSHATIDKLLEQVKNMKQGRAVNLGLIGDARFDSKFSGYVVKEAKTNGKAREVHVVLEQPAPVRSRKKEMAVRYSYNSDGKGRSEVQKACMTNHATLHTVPSEVLACSLDDCLVTDKDGNNLFHLLAYSGQCAALKAVLERTAPTPAQLMAENNDKETAVTLAIKARGFWHTLRLLFAHGATVPGDRVNGLKEYSVDKGFTATAALLDENGVDCRRVDSTMTADYVAFQYDTAVTTNAEIDVQNYLDVCLEKAMHKHVKMLLKDHGAKPTIDMLLTHCIPKKPDDPETEKYLELAKTLVNHTPALLTEANENGEGPLFKSAEKGSLPHVKYFLVKGCEVDGKNSLGNTPLWIATNKIYPCIMEALLDAGADPNATNLKGNPPLYSVCQRGPRKVAEMLLARGADVGAVNKNGDTLVLLSCRNGQPEVLELLLNAAEEEIIRWKAEIDGFDAMLAATESDKPECIKVLHRHGFCLESKTDPSNPILPGATPLHLAAYYNRLAAARELLALGADPNCRDIYNRTPLHIAALQGNPAVVSTLLAHGCDPHLTDDMASTALGYSRSNEEITDILLDPLLEPLLDLCRGAFGDNEKMACDMLLQSSAAPDVNLMTALGYTPLTTAVLNNRLEVVRTLLALGANPNLKSPIGLGACFWAQCVKNPKIKSTLADATPTLTANAFKRVDAAAKMSSLNAQTLYLSSPPRGGAPVLPPSSGLPHRMSANINELTSETSFLLPSSGDYSPVSDLLRDKDADTKLWNAKVHTVGLIGAGVTSLLPVEALLLSLLSSGSEVYDMVNASLPSAVGNIVGSAVAKLDRCEGEFFIGAPAVRRTSFLPGAGVCWGAFLSGSSLWRIAIDHLPDFATKRKEGTVFIVKSKHARYVSQHSPYAMD
eukprot:TRINITY_DN8419_c0_g1_i1.p1 TRINITY_DN8419_c0_g1~~TRINITY_DN8419_c0_g1_i1.p1  ORF type:complete len:1347 (+),score=463.82 TRINITY_DN8419_c0_g1_i1:471-4043(+)